MPGPLQTFFAQAATKAADDLIAALDRIPEDKQTWSPEGKARSAMDQIAEVAMLNGTTADIIVSGSWPSDYDFGAYVSEKATLAEDREKALALLRETTAKVAAAILAAPDELLSKEVAMPWGPMTITDMVAYPYWNAIYHQGQINYIASMLGCLD